MTATATAPAAADALSTRVSDTLARHLSVHLDRLDWGATELAEHQRARLRILLAHAIEHSPFHAKRLGGVDPEGIELSDLAGLPVMTKADMMADFDEVVTDRRLRRSAVEEHLRRFAHEPALLHDTYVCLASGGSSGLRGIFVQTVEEFADFGASFMRRGVARLKRAGGPPPGGVLAAYVAAESAVHTTGFGAATVKGGPVRFVPVPVTRPLAEIVERLNELQPPMLMGYPSILARLAREQQGARLRISPRAVTTSSEPLTSEDRDLITSAFGVPVVDGFGATEGLVGQSEPGETTLTFATDMCIAELVDAENRPVPPGVASAKVLVTNLHNLTQPLIRYELTDAFIQQPDTTGGFLRATVDGRADDAFRYGGVDVHPHAIRGVLVKTAAVREYQVHQTARGIDVNVVAEASLDQAALADALARSLAQGGLDEPHVAVHRIDEIARHPQTGKIRRFVPLP